MKKKLLILLGITLLGTTTMLVTAGSARAHYIPPASGYCGCTTMTYSEPPFIW